MEIRKAVWLHVQQRWKGWAGTFLTFFLLIVSGQGDLLKLLSDRLLPAEGTFGTAAIELSPVFKEGEPVTGQLEELLLLMHNDSGLHETKVLEVENIHREPKVAVGSVGSLVEATIPPRTQLVAVPVAEIRLPPATLAAIKVEGEVRKDGTRGHYRYIAGDIQGRFDAPSLVLSTPNDRRRRLFVWCSLLALATIISLSAPSFRTLRYPPSSPEFKGEESHGGSIRPSGEEACED